MSIHAMKGVAIGDGFDVAGRVGSNAHDEIFWDDEHGYRRETNHAGGLEGGMTTGQPLVVRAAMKPLPTLTKPLRSVDTETKEPAEALREPPTPAPFPRPVSSARRWSRSSCRCLPREVRWRRDAGRDRCRGCLQEANRMARLEPGGRNRGSRRRCEHYRSSSYSSGSWAWQVARRAPRQAVARHRPARQRCSLEEELGEPIPTFFERQGEAAFREREEALVLGLLDRPDARVIALGGGAVLSDLVRERLTDHLCIYMEVEPEIAWERVRESPRPLAHDRTSFLDLLSQRAPIYESVARAVIPARDDLIEHALPAAARLAAAHVPSSARMIWAGTASGGHPVFVGDGVLDAATSLLPVDTRFWSWRTRTCWTSTARGSGLPSSTG